MKEEITGEWRKLHNEGLPNLFPADGGSMDL
jgi:hypothetical protein